MFKETIILLLLCNVVCAMPKNDTIVVVVDKTLDFVNKVYNKNSRSCIEIKGNYLQTKKDNVEFARIYFCLLDNIEVIVRSRNFINRHYETITAEELNKVDDIDKLYSLFPYPAPDINIRRHIKVYLIFKEDWNRKDEIKLYPVMFSANEMEYCMKM